VFAKKGKLQQRILPLYFEMPNHSTHSSLVRKIAAAMSLGHASFSPDQGSRFPN
jgi:hypothetical protein